MDLVFNHIVYFLEYYYDDIIILQNPQKALGIYLYFLVVKDKYNSEYRTLLHGKFSIDIHQQSRWGTVKKRFLINEEIKEFLTDISDGKANAPTMGMISKYGLFEKNQTSTFLNHMENILNYRL